MSRWGMLVLGLTISITATVPVTANLAEIKETLRAAAIQAGCAKSFADVFTNPKIARVGMRSSDGLTVEIYAGCEIETPPAPGKDETGYGY